MSRSQLAYDHIRSKLIRDRIDPRKGLSEPVLAKELCISRTPVREAIRRLESEGLLEQRPRRGTFIRQLDRREFDEIYQLRLLLEPFAAAEAATKIRSKELRRLERMTAEILRIARLLRDMDDAERCEELWLEHRGVDIAFHEVILQAAGNQRLMKILTDAGILLKAMSFPETTMSHAAETLARNYRQHARILQAIRKGNVVAARERMHEHLDLGWRNVGRFLDALDDGSQDVTEVLPAPRERERRC